MDKKKTIDALNRLVAINNDRIEGYKTASNNTEEIELKTLFAKFSKLSQNYRRDLIREIKQLGGEAEEGIKMSGKIFCTWMDIKSALSGNDRKVILNSCEEGDVWAVETYSDMLNDKSNHLTLEQQTMVTNQYDSIKADQNKIRSMQNNLAEVN